MSKDDRKNYGNLAELVSSRSHRNNSHGKTWENFPNGGGGRGEGKWKEILTGGERGEREKS